MVKRNIYLFITFLAFVTFMQHASAQDNGKDNASLHGQSEIHSQVTTSDNSDQELEQEVETFKTEHKANVAAIVSTIHEGARGSDVSEIQTVLALDPTIYASTKIDGVFGPFTLSAMKKFQAANGLTADGVVGPKTKSKLDDVLAENDLTTEDTNGDNKNDKVCNIIPPGHLIAPGWLKHNGGIGPTIPNCQTLPAAIVAKLGANSPSGTGTTPPVINAITTSAITATTASISFTTDELTKANVWYSKTSPLITTDNLSTQAIDSTLATTHTIVLTGLTPSTPYYIVVGATDKANNTTNSSQQSFTTIAGTADTTGPVISSISTSSVAATGSQINWTTDEVSTSKVYYSTANPVDLATANTQSATSLSLSHTLILTGLTSNTTYYYVVESIDGAMNKTTAPQNTFTTIK